MSATAVPSRPRSTADAADRQPIEDREMNVDVSFVRQEHEGPRQTPRALNLSP
jgi:hypothetical protein